jgi:type I restriction enzyme, R subunit
VLRHGLELIGVRGLVSLAQFAPASGMNPEIVARYQANRVRVIRQLRYSRANENCIDLGLFLNGVPVATVELKTDFTQSIGDAIDQYRRDRNPKNDPLLTFARGALVHFAVSNREVMSDHGFWRPTCRSCQAAFGIEHRTRLCPFVGLNRRYQSTF